MTDALQAELQAVPECEVLPVCPNCSGEVDGNGVSFIDERRTRCNRIACVLKYDRQREIQIRRGLQRSRKFSHFF